MPMPLGTRPNPDVANAVVIAAAAAAAAHSGG